MQLRGQIRYHVDALINTPNSLSQWILSQPSWVENAPVFTTYSTKMFHDRLSTIFHLGVLTSFSVRRKITRVGGKKRNGCHRDFSRKVKTRRYGPPKLNDRSKMGLLGPVFKTPPVALFVWKGEDLCNFRKISGDSTTF